MRTAVVAVIMGLGETPEGKCLGLRAHVENLARTYPILPLFLSYKLSTPQVIETIARARATINQDHAVILSGHSLGGGQAHEAASYLESVDALGIFEPVPEDHAFDGGYKFDVLYQVKSQLAIRIDGPFPIAWGREYVNPAFNLKIHPWKFTGIIANCHAEICQRPEVLGWYDETVKRVCEGDLGEV